MNSTFTLEIVPKAILTTLFIFLLVVALAGMFFVCCLVWRVSCAHRRKKQLVKKQSAERQQWLNEVISAPVEDKEEFKDSNSPTNLPPEHFLDWRERKSWKSEDLN